jgi:hypothetical protein
VDDSSTQLHTRCKLVSGLVDRDTEPVKERLQIGRRARSPWYVWINCGDGSIKNPQGSFSTHQERQELQEDHQEKLGQHGT